MKVDNREECEVSLCGRCHLPTHKTVNCTEFGDNCCPRCLEWDHWEDSCWAADSITAPVCSRSHRLSNIQFPCTVGNL